MRKMARSDDGAGSALSQTTCVRQLERTREEAAEIEQKQSLRFGHPAQLSTSTFS